MESAAPRMDTSGTLFPVRLHSLEKIFWILLPILGFLFFLYQNTHESLWADEAYTLGVANLNPLEIWRIGSKDVHPPLYYFILWFFSTVFGSSIGLGRAVSALGGFGLLAIGAGPLRRALGAKTALIFLLMTAGAPGVLAYAQDIRMYIWAAFFVTGMAVYLYLATRDGRREDWLLTFAFTACAMYTHLFSLMAAAFLGLFGLAYVLLRRRAQSRACLAAFGAAGLFFLPWAANVLDQVRSVSKEFWIPPVTWETIRLAFDFPYGLKFHDAPESIVIAAAVAAALLGGLGYALLRRKEAALPGICLLAYLAVFAAAVGFSLAVKPILVNRYMLPITGLWLVAVAYALSQFRRELAAVAVAVLLLAQAPALSSILRDRYNGPMQEVAEHLAPLLQPGDIIVHTDEHTVVTFAYYFPETTQVAYLPPGSQVFMNLTVFPNVEVVTDLQPVLARGRRIWLATRQYGGNQAAYGMAVGQLGLLWVPHDVFYAGSEELEFGSARYFAVPGSWYAVILDHTP